MRRLAILLAFVGLVGCNEPPPATTGPGRAQPAIRGAPARSAATARREVEAPGQVARATHGAPEPSHDRAERPQPGEPEAQGRAPDRGGARGALIEASAPLRLETSLEPTQGKWVARWTLSNRGREPLYVATQLPTQRRGRIVPSRQRLYVRAQEGALHLTKRLWRIPRAVQAFVRELPYLERLEPGQSVAGAVRVPPLVAENHPYQAGGVRETQLVREVVISFGFFTQEAEPQPVAGTPGLYQVPYEAISEQRFVESPAHPARLSVR